MEITKPATRGQDNQLLSVGSQTSPIYCSFIPKWLPSKKVLRTDDNVIRRREINSNLKRKAQENLHEKPAKLLQTQLEPNYLNVLTTQDINAIRQSVYYVRSKSLPKLPKSTEEAQDSLDKINVTILADKTSVTYGKAFSALCDHLNLQVVFVDFEEAIHIALQKMWPSVNIKGCGFHLSQSWWWMIQSVGLALEFRDKDSGIGGAVKYLFGLPYLPPSDVLDCFTDDLMAIKPIDDKIDKVFDYIFENYITPDSRFPPKMWADRSSAFSLTTNGCEAFLSKFNKEFNITHPNIFKVIDILINIQSETQMKARNHLIV
ncbi:hypothetical protein AGLY_016125 [Aphis glycines]|uniref:MULE transposase domain-containing protein n=1 Tax=Aphis glycines TaxID=307491 RepID=A0A6G0SYX3_APHGL|nr:hypothetical protein AGLY_016125 [Aphis glycines]